MPLLSTCSKNKTPRQKPAGCKFNTIKKSRAYALASPLKAPLRRMRRGRAKVINTLMGAQNPVMDFAQYKTAARERAAVLKVQQEYSDGKFIQFLR